jgi:ribonuclease Z
LKTINSEFTPSLHHRIPTTGFKFEEKPKSENIRKEIIEGLHLTIDQIKLLKSGNAVCMENGSWISPSEACYRKETPRSFAYVSDTKYDPSIVKYIRGVDLLFHESTYMTEAEQLAVDRMHCTAFQAATIAQKAAVKKLVLGHFSSRYSDLLPMLDEARSVFPTSWLGLDGNTFEF